MKANLIFSIVISLSICQIQAQQQVVSTAGNFHSNSSGSVAWTLGELSIESYTVSGYILTQGFHQGILTITSIDEIPEPGFEIKVFPNPASDQLLIRIDKELTEILSFQLFDLSGKLIMQGGIRESVAIIPVDHLKASVYLLRVSKGGRQVKTFKVVKQ